MNTAHRQSSRAKHRYQADPMAMWRAVGRSTGFNQSEQTECALPVRLAWSALRNGTANAYDIEALSDVIAICIVASESMDALVQETCEAARLALAEIADRFARLKCWGVDAKSLQDIPPILDLYDELLRTATGGQFERWMVVVKQCKEQMQGVVS